jgi:anaerobic ribonucleoside-triphosphate reductase activating protein
LLLREGDGSEKVKIMEKEYSYKNIIIFDLFETILDDVSNDYRSGLEYLQREVLNDCTMEELWAVAEDFRRQYMSNRTFTNKEAKMLNQLALFQERIGFKIDLSIEDVEYQFFNVSRKNKLNDGVVDVLTFLKSKNYTLYVMSNTIFSSQTIKKCLSDFGIADYFQNVYTSSDCGYRKPSQKFFNSVYKSISSAVKTNKKDVLFVGNSLGKDAIGATRFGFTPVWLSNKNDGFGEYLADCARIEKLYDLQQYIEENYIYVSGISKQYSQADGPGNRLVVYLQGCDRHCEGCHNEKTWSFDGGIRFSVKELVAKVLSNLSESARNVTVSGGEPLCQPNALNTLLDYLKRAGLNVCLYTGYEFDEVPQTVKDKVDYLKTGCFILSQRTTVSGFYGSKNQKMWEKKANAIWQELK